MVQQIQKLIEQSIQYFQSGLPNKAEELLLKVLKIQSNNLHALEILGLIKASQGQHVEAAKLLKMFVKLNPNNPAAQYNLAKALSECKNYIDSLIHYEVALQLSPNNPDCWLNYGQTLLRLNRYEAAITALDEALSFKPQYFEGWYSKALAHSELKQYANALDCYSCALQLNPNDAKIWLNASVCFGMLGRYKEAIGCCDRSLALQPNYPEALLNKGSALSELRDFDGAISCYNQALMLNNNYADAWFSKGVAFQAMERHAAAIDAFNSAISVNHHYAQAHCNKGLALQNLKNFDEAINSYNNAIEAKPEYVEALSNKGLTYYELANYTASIQEHNRAISISPNYDDAYLNKSFAQLILGDLNDGWKNYEYRWTKKHAEPFLHANIPRLSTLTEIKNKRVLVWAEQGFGDTIQFARYIPLLIELGAEIVFEVQPPLKSLFKDQYACSVIAKGESIDDVDFQIPLLSLPLLFKTNLDSIPANTPYIQLPAEIIQEWYKKLPISSSKLNIGIACSGNPNVDKKNGNKRPIPLQYFSEIIGRHNLFLIQKEIRDSDVPKLKEFKNLHTIGDLIYDFKDTAAIIENMDLIISIDTSLAHLAGALNKKLYVLLPFSPDWRWLASGTKNPWYPSATLFRQTSIGDWKSAMDEALKAISVL